MILALQQYQPQYQPTQTPTNGEPEMKGFIGRIKRGIEFLGDWFSDQPDDYLITEYGFLKAFVEWD